MCPMVPASALLFGIVSLLGVFVCSLPQLGAIGPALVSFGPVAIILGVVSRFRSTNRMGFWAVVIGIVASLFLPTVWLPFFRT